MEDCVFLGICPFLLGCPVCWHVIFHSIPIQSFLFLWYSCYFSLIYDVFGFSLFFFLWVWLKVYQFCSCFQRTSSWIHWLFYCFVCCFCCCFSFYIIYFCSIISFLLLAWGFVCSSFSSSFRCKARLFIWDFSCFFR